MDLRLTEGHVFCSAWPRVFGHLYIHRSVPAITCVCVGLAHCNS